MSSVFCCKWMLADHSYSAGQPFPKRLKFPDCYVFAIAEFESVGGNCGRQCKFSEAQVE